MKRDLAWFEAKALGFPGLTIEEAEAGWPKTLRPVSLAKLQRPYTILASEGYFSCEVMRKALDAACRDAAIERFATVDFEEYARRFFENQFTPQAFLAWLAKQGEPPSEHIVAWAKANGISVPEVPKAAPVQGMAAAQGEAETAALAKVAAPVQLAIVPPAETAAERRDRRFQACLAAGLRFPDTYTNRLPDGVGRVADKEGVSRQAFSKDVREGWQRSIEARQAADELKQA